jgi:hypothetical protein
VVASAVGGLVDTVVHDVTGVHVPPRRPGLVATAIAELLADPDRRAALGAAGARRARRRYGWDRIARSTVEVYAGLPAGQLATVGPDPVEPVGPRGPAGTLWTTTGASPSRRLRSPTGGANPQPGRSRMPK